MSEGNTRRGGATRAWNGLLAVAGAAAGLTALFYLARALAMPPAHVRREKAIAVATNLRHHTILDASAAGVQELDVGAFRAGALIGLLQS